MKAVFRTLLFILVAALALPLIQCGKDDPLPPDPREYLYDKFWYNNEGLGDYKFKKDGTYEYVVPWGTTTGQYMWYNDVVDSMKVVQSGGGDWTIWFREITEHQFKMSQSNEDHANIYTYKDTKP